MNRNRIAIFEPEGYGCLQLPPRCIQFIDSDFGLRALHEQTRSD